MATGNLVLIDTCIWVPFFDQAHSIHKARVEELLEDDQCALIGPVLSEVLVGFKKDNEADWVASALKGLHYIELTREDWISAARLGRRLAGLGHRLPLTDLAMIAIAQRRNLAVYTIDPHFDLVPQLRRFP